MSKVKPIPSVEFLRECFDYDTVSGELRWKQRPRSHFKSQWAWKVWNKRYPGKIAGAISNTGHRFLGSGYLAHRLIFKMMTGEEPGSIDHIDGNPDNNAWSNLRVATKVEQAWNSKFDSKRSVSGIRGVRQRGAKWQALITVYKKTLYLGLFHTCEEASAAYEKVARGLHGKFYRETKR